MFIGADIAERVKQPQKRLLNPFGQDRADRVLVTLPVFALSLFRTAAERGKGEIGVFRIVRLHHVGEIHAVRLDKLRQFFQNRVVGFRVELREIETAGAFHPFHVLKQKFAQIFVENLHDLIHFGDTNREGDGTLEIGIAVGDHLMDHVHNAGGAVALLCVGEETADSVNLHGIDQQ